MALLNQDVSRPYLTTAAKRKINVWIHLVTLDPLQILLGFSVAHGTLCHQISRKEVCLVLGNCAYSQTNKFYLGEGNEPLLISVEHLQIDLSEKTSSDPVYSNLFLSFFHFFAFVEFHSAAYHFL